MFLWTENLVFMDERFEQVRKILVTQKQEILQKIRGKKDNQDKQGGDFIDIATDSLEHELNYIFEERERDKLHNIEEALKRMQEGTYGECDECGDDIDLEEVMASSEAEQLQTMEEEMAKLEVRAQAQPEQPEQPPVNE